MSRANGSATRHAGIGASLQTLQRVDRLESAGEDLDQRGVVGGSRLALDLTHRSVGGTGDPAENFVDGSSALSTGTEHQVVAVWNETDTTDGPTGTQYLYLDGVLVGHSAIRSGISLATLSDVNNWLGRSQWPDPLIDAKYDDFRIFNTALSAQDVVTDFNAGPNQVGVPEPSVVAIAMTAACLGLARRRRVS